MKREKIEVNTTRTKVLQISTPTVNILENNVLALLVLQQVFQVIRDKIVMRFYYFIAIRNGTYYFREYCSIVL